MGVPLSDLEAEILTTRSGDARIQALWFRWDGHQHAIHFGPCSEDAHGLRIWKHGSGSTIDDLTLSPSYLCRAPESHRLHCFIRNGHLVVC